MAHKAKIKVGALFSMMAAFFISLLGIHKSVKAEGILDNNKIRSSIIRPLAQTRTIQSTSSTFFRPSAGLDMHQRSMTQVNVTAFENWLRDQGYNAKELSSEELGAAAEEFRLEQFTKRLDELESKIK